MFQKLIDKGKCSLGFHSGDWRYENATSCVQIQVCDRCSKHSQRTQHGWEDWQFLADNDCTLQRICPRCGEVENKVEHNWSADQYYQTPGACETFRFCERCDAQLDSGVIHEFTGWRYQSEDTCQQVQVCSRCGAFGSEERLHHDWSAWQYSSFYQAQVSCCRHCGETVVDSDGAGDPGQIPSLQTTFTVLQEVLSAQTTQELRQQIADNQTILYSPALQSLSLFLEDQGNLSESDHESLNSVISLIGACQQNGIEAVFAQIEAPAPASASASPPPTQSVSAHTDGQLDTNLIGRWRHTSIDSSGSFSQVTDYYLNLDGVGNVALSSKTVNNFGEQTSPVDSGRWTASGGYLSIEFPGVEREINQYVIQGNTLFFPDSSRKIWERY